MWEKINTSEFIAYDMTLSQSDISTLEITKSSKGNCLIKEKNDLGKYYKSFILAKNKINYTECIVSFYPSKDFPNKFIPRLSFQIVKKTGELAESVKSNDRTRRIDFKDELHGLFNYWDLMSFFNKFKNIVDTGIFDDKFEIVGKDDIIRTLKKSEDKQKDLVDISKQIGISIEDVFIYEEAKKREESLKVFKMLLENKDDYVSKYRDHHKITALGNEAVWHHFLINHKWVFGLNLDLRFIEDFADEQSVGNPTSENRANPTVDMIGFTDYTVLIELKTPESNIFTVAKGSKSRANTWTFNNEFIEGFSQCLGQRSDFEKNIEAKILEKDGIQIDKIKARTVDPKIIFLFGNKNREIPIDSKETKIAIQRDTLERFIRNNRNVEFISYDELYRRANYIVNGDCIEKIMTTQSEETIGDKAKS